MLFCFCIGGSKGLVELRWREGIAERFGMDQTEARRTSERKDSVNGNKEMELEDLSVTNSS